MKRGIATATSGFAIFLTLLLMATAGAQTVIAGEYHCKASNDRCSVSVSGMVTTVTCMNTGAVWSCTSGTKGIECLSSSQTKTIPSNQWAQDIYKCLLLCGNCGGGWQKYEGGGSTF